MPKGIYDRATSNWEPRKKGTFNHTQATINKIIKAKKGVPKSEEFKENLRGKLSPKKGKTFEEMYGEERATEMKSQLSISSKKASWNRGSTAETDERIRKSADARTGIKRTEETKNKIRESKKGIRTSLGMTGKNHTEETKNSLREKNTGRILGPHTKEHSDKISNGLKGNKNRLGDTQTEETREKIRVANKGKKYALGYKFTKEQRNTLSIAKTGVKQTPYTDERKKTQRLGRIAYIEKTKGPMYPTIGMLEKQIIDEIERVFGCVMLRQYRVCGYFVDGYIPEKKVAIEVDEPRHFKIDGNYTVRDIRRQKEIEKELGCRFIRIII